MLSSGRTARNCLAAAGAKQLLRKPELLQQLAGQRFGQQRNIQATARQRGEATPRAVDERLDPQQFPLQKDLHADYLSESLTLRI